MADIFLARSANEAGIERYVVLKRVLAERSRDPHFATMFLDEARLAAQLQHPNIAQVHDIGTLGGSYFYTMEYVHGEDVRHVLQRLHALRRKLPVNLALHAAAGALAGLQHAHARTAPDGKPLGVIHRDVSPSNVMISFEGSIKLLDFGVAKASQRSTESRAGAIKGKIMYLSPEQCQGGTIDRRSDLFALGIVLHEMLIGRRLYKRDTDFQTMMAIVNEPPPPPSSLRPDVSPAIDAIVLTALSKDPDKRYASANDMIEAIEAVAMREGLGLSVTSAGKFMRELFGERPEPWLELAARDEDPKQVTVTGESVVSLDSGAAIAAPATFSPSAAVRAEQSLEAQLQRAPAIGRQDDPDLSAGTSLPRVPSGPTSFPVIGTPTENTSLGGVVHPYPASADLSVGSRSTGGLSAIRTTPFWRRRAFVIVASAVTVVLAIVIATEMFGGSSTPASTHASAVGSAALVTVPAPAIDATAIASNGSAVGSDMGASAGSSEGSGASAGSAAPSPPPTPTRTPKPTIDTAFAAGDWTATLELCVHTGSPTNLERVRCGVAACNGKQRAIALGYHEAVNGAAQTTIERACRDHGIVLVRPARSTPSGTKNPCDDKQYREQNPLKCQ